MRRVVLIALATLTVLAPAAAARPVPDEMLRVARAAWPESPCRAQESVEIDAVILPFFVGMAFTDCEAVIAPSNPVRMCEVLTHELGHLAGYGHAGRDDANPAPRDPARAWLMTPVPGAWEPCQRFSPLCRSRTPGSRPKACVPWRTRFRKPS